MDPQEPQEISISLSWVGFDETPITYANQFLIQFQSEGAFVLGVGQATAPPIIGEPQEVAEQLADIPFIPVRTLPGWLSLQRSYESWSPPSRPTLDNWERIQTRIDPRNA